MEQAKQTLIIVESPTKAKTISKFLPKNYKVIASKGHVRDLGEKDMAIDVDNGYACKYQIVDGKGPLIKELKDELAKSNQLLLATDEDREGESISWHLLQVLKPKVPYQRMVFHEITKGAIMKALENGRPLDENLVQAQEGRRVVDRLYGYTLSPTLWSKLANKKLSAGRVQSVGLRLTVDRERERILFEKHTYNDAVATLANKDGKQYQARLVSVAGKPLAGSKDYDSITGAFKGKDVVLADEEKISEVIKSLNDVPFVVTDLQKKPFVTHPSIPFTTSTLQQDAIKKFHISAAQVMSIAQKLYENGFITYMRTDSPTLSHEGTMAARESVEKLYGSEYLNPSVRTFVAHTAGAQEAHEAIRPSGDHFRTPEETGLSGREFLLYDLIWKRTLACQMADARKSTTTATVTAGEAVFTASGTQILFPGFIRAYVEGSDDPDAALSEKETVLPPLTTGEVEKLIALSAEAHQTKPRARYTEASLVQELEKRGIGRPSTYATILKTLLDRSYVQKENGSLVPTFMGFAVCQYLEQHFAKFVDYDFTSRMESDLDRIAEGKEQKLDFLNAFYKGPAGLLEQNQEQRSQDNKTSVRTISLPQIKEDHPIMIGPYGCYLLKKGVDGAKDTYITLPSDWTPGSVTDDMVADLMEKGGKGAVSDPIGDGIELKSGKFGPYWQKDDKRSSVPAWASEEERHSSAFALPYLSLPRVLGKDAEGKEVFASLGKYGPYVGCDGKYRNLNKTDRNAQLFSVTLEEALSLLSQEKTTAFKKGKSAAPRKSASASSSAVLELGTFENLPLSLAHGRYGFYVKHGKENYSLPTAYRNDEAKAKTLSSEQAIEIIKEKRQKETM